MTSAPAPQPPFWHELAVSPYSGRRATPLSLDTLQLTLSAHERLEVEICESPQDALSRSRLEAASAVVDAAEFTEVIFGRGAEAMQFLVDSGVPTTLVISPICRVPDAPPERSLLAITTWPCEPGDLRRTAQEAKERGWNWGLVVPVIFPVTTSLPRLEKIAAIAGEEGATFLASCAVDIQPAAKQQIASLWPLEEEEYATLFHSDLDTITVATERHIAALARERGIADSIPAHTPCAKRNWNAAIVLARAGNRLVRMGKDVELGWTLLRSARVIAQLPKSVDAIAEAASLSIVEGVDPLSAEIVDEWLSRGSAEFVEDLDRAWPLRRDHLPE